MMDEIQSIWLRSSNNPNLDITNQTSLAASFESRDDKNRSGPSSHRRHPLMFHKGERERDEYVCR